jgi:hypothetical protein
MFGPYDCPDCHRLHDEPAEAVAAFRVQCLDCSLKEPATDAVSAPELPHAA